MIEANQRIWDFLAALKAVGRSSPSDWHKFHLFLKAKKVPGQSDPPVPLILAASDESNATKHHRLGEQLEWALANQCLDATICYLEKLTPEQWNSCPMADWYKDSYPNIKI